MPLVFALLTGAEKPSGGYSFGDVFQLVVVLLVMAAVIAAAYFLTRLIAGGNLRMQRQLNRMKVVDRLIIARDRAVVVIELGGRYYMVGVGGNAITLLTEVDGSPYGQEEPVAGGASFLSALQGKLAPKDSARRGAADPSRDRDASTQQEEMERALERMRARSKSWDEHGKDRNE